MRKTGTLITCDRCDTNGTFIQDNQYDVYPEDWSHYDGKDICPTCSEELHILAEQLDFFDEGGSGEWHTLCDWVVDLPYSELIVGDSGLKEEAKQEEVEKKMSTDRAINIVDYYVHYMIANPEMLLGPKTQALIDEAWQVLAEKGQSSNG